MKRRLTKQAFGQMIGDDELVREGKEQEKHAEDVFCSLAIIGTIMIPIAFSLSAPVAKSTPGDNQVAISTAVARAQRESPPLWC